MPQAVPALGQLIISGALALGVASASTWSASAIGVIRISRLDHGK